MKNSIITNHDAYKLADFQNNILSWAEYINLIEEGCIDKQISKIKEEVNEYQEAIESCKMEEAGCELVDILVTCIVSAEQNGIKITDYMPLVVDKLISRQDTGRIVDGQFIKKEDLPDE